jgi:putative membrane protein
MMGFGHGMVGLGGWGLLGGIFLLVLLFVVLVAVALLIIWAWRRSTSPASRAMGASPSAREILEMRYARGELTRDEFQRMLQDISQPRT